MIGVRRLSRIGLTLAALLLICQPAFSQTTNPEPTPAPPSATGTSPRPSEKPTADTTRKGETASSTTGEKPPLAGWDNGIFLRSADKRFQLRITGQLQADYRAYLDPNDRVDVDSFLARRARMGLEATLFEFYEFRFLTDFGQSQTRLQDAFMNVHYWNEFQFTAGKFKQPVSYEQLIQDRFVPLMERSLIDQLVPARDVGVMLHGQGLFGNRLDYAAAVSNGVQNGDSDTNDAKDVTARIAVRPFAGFEDGPFKQLQIGISGGTGVEGEPVNPTVLRTPAGVPFFQFARGVTADGVRSRFSPEAAYFFDGFGMSAQYFRMTQRLLPSSAIGTVVVPFDGFYVQATYLLTGEKRTGYSQQIAPLRPFDPRSGPSAGPGAWELVARVSRLHVGDVVFTPGPARLADPFTSSDGATEWTFGFNWYLNQWARVQFNWEHARFNSPVLLGPLPGGRLSSQNTLMTRLQFIF